jgi:FlaA1/EpsC-like NDP-sugar epimerase/lipopolysaccharide/colanic/teichoic acid biosynthesis glycosyltransferase
MVREKMTTQRSRETFQPGLPRAVELLLAFAGLVAAAPILILAALMIRISSRGPVLFRQSRVGRYGRRFVLYKLRTMRSSSGGAEITCATDNRITPIGRILRFTKIDELPELWNVIKGEMSLVGPRPEVPAFVCLEDKLWQSVLETRPGITDPGTLALRNEQALLASIDGPRQEEFYRQILQPYKLRGYLGYQRVRDWKSDVRILSKTLITLFVAPERSLLTADEIRESALAGGDSALPEGPGTRAATRGPIDAPEKEGSHGARERLQFGAQYLWTKRYLILVDFSLLVFAFLLSYLLRFEFQVPAREVPAVERQFLYVAGLQSAVMLGMGIYHFIWRYMGLRETRAFVLAAVYSSLPILALRLGLPDSLRLWRVPLSVIIFDGVLVFTLTVGVRVLRRVIYERSLRRSGGSGEFDGPRKAVLLIGTGRAGQWIANEIRTRPLNDLEIIGFVDDEPQKRDAVIDDIKVLGATIDLPRLVREHSIDHVIISIADASRQEIRRILAVCEAIPVRVRVVPNLSEIIRGDVKFTRFRDVQIEDLLGREPVRMEQMSMEQFLRGKTVLVTGAGGSIGSELARQIAQHEPGKLLLVERAEFALFQIDSELRRLFPKLKIAPFVADVGNKRRIAKIIASHRPQVIVHAAAHKHVPMLEENVAEAVSNNVLATYDLCELAGASGVECFVLISTDKAVKPTSVMGTTKRVAELVIQHMNQQFATRYMAVRFGNVIGSTGSVIPIFQEQIRRGGPVTVTHPEMTRYFMTIPEAAQLVLEAAAMGEGGEIFVLDMGEPVSIVDLAKQLIVLTGLKPFEDIDIVFTGIRPGEKLSEELRLPEECMSKTRHPKIYIGSITGYSNGEILEGIERLTDLCCAGEERKIREALTELVSEAHLETKPAEMPMALKKQAAVAG